MNAAQPQWKPLPDSPGIWILERESELAALLGAKYAILEIKQCSLDRPTSSKYCVRAYGPIPTETAAAQIIRPEPQFSPHDLQQLQIDQLIRDVKELHQRFGLLRKEIDDCDTNRIANVEDLQSQVQAENAIVEQLTEKLNDIDRNELEHADSLRELIKIVGENLQKQLEQEKQTRIANDRAQVDFVNNIAARIDNLRHEFAGMERTPAATTKRLLAVESRINSITTHLAEMRDDNTEADKKILANAGAIARIIRHLERLPERQEKPAPDITEPTATEWDTNPEKMLGQINAELNRPPNAEVKPEDVW